MDTEVSAWWGIVLLVGLMAWLLWDGWGRDWYRARRLPEVKLNPFQVDGGIRKRMANLRRNSTPHS